MTAVPSDENQFLLRDRRCKEFTTEGPCSLKFILSSLFVLCGAAGLTQLGATGLGEACLRFGSLACQSEPSSPQRLLGL